MVTAAVTAAAVFGAGVKGVENPEGDAALAGVGVEGAGPGEVRVEVLLGLVRLAAEGDAKAEGVLGVAGVAGGFGFGGDATNCERVEEYERRRKLEVHASAQTTTNQI
jgi:hypothetical protein